MSLEETRSVIITTPTIITLTLFGVLGILFKTGSIKGILKFPEKKEAMVIDEDPFPPVALINIAATDLRALLNAKKVEGFSPSVKIRKVWIPNKYLVYIDDLVVERGVFAVREKKKEGHLNYSSRKKKSMGLR